MKLTHWLLAAACVGAGCSALAQSRFSVSADGSEVTDSKTGLIWQRCSAGQSWSGGTCIGTASTFTHGGALTYALGQPSWRLPNVKELNSIWDKTKSLPAIDGVVFPGTVPFEYWTSSPYVGNAGFAWFVNFGYGNVDGDGYPRSNLYHVRLVR